MVSERWKSGTLSNSSDAITFKTEGSISTETLGDDHTFCKDAVDQSAKNVQVWHVSPFDYDVLSASTPLSAVRPVLSSFLHQHTQITLQFHAKIVEGLLCFCL